MTFRIQKYVVRLDVSVHNALLVDIADRATELSNPKAHSLFGKGLARDVKAQIAAIHQVYHDVSSTVRPMTGELGGSQEQRLTDIQCPGSCNASCTGKGG